MSRACVVVLVGCALFLGTAEARKKPPASVPPASPAPPPADRPWAAGVSAEAQAQALEIFKQGNALFEESKHAEAMAKYKQALALWDHPAIRYNLAVSLIHLDQPLAAYDNLLLCLKYGAAALGQDTYNQALTNKKLLTGQISEIKISCQEPGAQVSLDGESLFVGPGEASRRLTPGRHQLVAAKAGYLTETRALVLLPGEKSEESLKLTALRALATKRRWAVWKPPVVLSAGVLVAAIGVPLILAARSSFGSYDARVDAECPNGCLPTSDVSALKSRGDAEYGASLAMFAVGGAVAVSGLVMVILNQPHVVESNKAPRVSWTPLFGPGLAAARLGVHF